MNELYRFELEYCGEPQGVGFIVGLKDLGVPDKMLNELVSEFDKRLVIPNYEQFVYNKTVEYPASYFTKRGRELFYPSIRGIIDYVNSLDSDWEVVEEVIHQTETLYQDALQAVVIKNY